MKTLRENVRTLLFAAGLGAFYAGVAGFSPPAANVALGLVLMTGSAWPYLSRPRKG